MYPFGDTYLSRLTYFRYRLLAETFPTQDLQITRLISLELNSAQPTFLSEVWSLDCIPIPTSEENQDVRDKDRIVWLLTLGRHSARHNRRSVCLYLCCIGLKWC